MEEKKSKVNAPRTCDIDIIDYKGTSYKLEANNDKLLIPHPRLHNRNFVLFPLLEIEKKLETSIKKNKYSRFDRKIRQFFSLLY